MPAGFQAWDENGVMICDLSTVFGQVHNIRQLPQYHPGQAPASGRFTVPWPDLPGTRWYFYNQPILNVRTSRFEPWIPLAPRIWLEGNDICWDWPMYDRWTRNYDGGDGQNVHRYAILGGGWVCWGVR